MRRIKSFLIIICLLSIYTAFLYGCERKERSDSHNNEVGLPEIVIGSDNYPPYNYVDTDGNATGIDVELATEAFKEWAIRPDSYILTGRIRRIFLLTEQLIVHGEALAWMAGRMNTDGQDLI